MSMNTLCHVSYMYNVCINDLLDTFVSHTREMEDKE